MPDIDRTTRKFRNHPSPSLARHNCQYGGCRCVCIVPIKATNCESHLSTLVGWRIHDQGARVRQSRLPKGGGYKLFILAPNPKELPQSAHRTIALNAANDNQRGVVWTEESISRK